MHDVSDLPAMGLEVLAGREGLARNVRWVHASEMVDPTAWLKGGELLLTTGLQVDSAEEFADYTERLAGADVAGIGFGVGPRWASVPQPLLDTADAHGLPVLQVPIDTPYVAISEAVSQLLAAERYAVLAEAVDAQPALTSAALAGGPGGVVAELAGLVDGWALLVHSSMAPIAASPPEAEDRLPELLPEVLRLRERGGHTGRQVVRRHEVVAMHPLAAGGQVRGFLLVATPGGHSDYARLVVAAAVPLLALELERARTVSHQAARMRGDVLTRILRGEVPEDEAARRLGEWGMDPARLRVHVLLADPRGIPHLLRSIVDRLADGRMVGAAAVVGSGNTTHVAVLSDQDTATASALEGVAQEDPSAALGIGDRASGDLRRSHGEALHAAHLGRTEQRLTTHFEHLNALRLLLRAQTHETIAGFTQRVLGPLWAEEGRRDGPLVTSLRVFLSRNGHWQDSAAELGVHRHTLRARMDRVAAVTGRDLDSAYTRMELSLALLASNPSLEI